MVTLTAKKEDYEAIVELAGKMQTAWKIKVPLGHAAGFACRYVLSETKRLEEALRKKKGVS